MSNEDERLGAALRRIATTYGQGPANIRFYTDRLEACARACEEEAPAPVDRILVRTEGASDNVIGLVENVAELITGKPCVVREERRDD